MLAGLTEECKPMITGIKGSGIKITGDATKLKLLEEVKVEDTLDAAFSHQKNLNLIILQPIIKINWFVYS